MGKLRQLVATQKMQIITLSKYTNKTHEQIAKELGISRSSVTRWILRNQDTGSTSVKKRSGRPLATSSRTDNLIKHEVTKDPFITSAKIKRNLKLSISSRTIRRRLSKKFRMQGKKPIKKPLLSNAMRRKRIEFCRKYQNWNEEWNNVLFSDESTFLQHSCTPKVVRILHGQSALNPRYTAKTIKHSAGVMVWGCFGYHGRGDLSFIKKEERMNSDMYLAILQGKLNHFMKLLHCDIFQQENAPCHTSKKSVEWFSRNSIQVLDWPGNSPDLNPIENLWQHMKNNIDPTKCETIGRLEQEITRVWLSEATQEHCAKLVSSMPRRIKAVLANKGFPTKY
jgi:transposase